MRNYVCICTDVWMYECMYGVCLFLCRRFEIIGRYRPQVVVIVAIVAIVSIVVIVAIAVVLIIVALVVVAQCS